MKRILRTALVLTSLSIWTVGCSSDNATSANDSAAQHGEAAHDHASHDHGAEASATSAAHSGEHTYSCPMHPEVTSNKPGECPKCGMNLEHTDKAAGDGKTYRMDLKATPAQPAAGQPVTLSFQPQVENDAQAAVPLATVHEKKMHLIIVSKDLSEFYHEHPDFKPSGRYDVPFTFKNGGDFVLFQDYQPQGGTHQLGRQTLTVSGAKKPAVTFRDDQMRWAKNGYEAVLSFDKAVQVGQPLAVQVNVSRGGKPVTDLDNYLGAKGHMVVISRDTEQYLHVHPQEGSTGSVVGFNTSFEKPGLYRVFLQFNHGGQIHTADFTVNVAGGAQA